MTLGRLNKVVQSPSHKRISGIQLEEQTFNSEAKGYHPYFHKRAATMEIDVAIDQHPAVTRLQLPAEDIVTHVLVESLATPMAPRGKRHVAFEEPESKAKWYQCICG